jgi:glycosyltransferase involved in cell wall biosynthesis
VTEQGTNENASSASGSRSAGGNIRILYISYDGIGEPLGRSQILGYLLRLSSGFEITLISFEKGDADLDALRVEMEAARITWFPQRYHRRPPVLSTLGDVLIARRVIRRLRTVYDIAHVRSYVAALIALVSGRQTWRKLLFDIRGFWADERVEGGLWSSGGWLYRLAKRCERWFFSEADAVVTLTEASVPHIRELLGGRAVPVTVIPTCVDLDRFDLGASRPDGPRAVWCGSVGTWYRFDLAAPMADALGLPLTVITRDERLAREVLAGHPADVTSMEPARVPDALFSGDVALCLIASSFSKTASAPTRFAECLASGMPAVVTRGVGDLEKVVQEHGVGVVLGGDEPHALGQAAGELLRLRESAGLPERCRRVAEMLFDVRLGAESYAGLYRQLSGGSAQAGG